MWEDQPDTSRILRKAVTDKGLSEAAAVPQWGLWWVSPVGYKQQTTVDDLRVIQASAQAWKERDYELDTYQPLVRYPDLFLRFARLAEDGGLDGGWDEWPQTDKNARVAKEWANQYGVLGLTPSKEPGAWWGEARGGLEDTVRAFAREAWTAYRVLRLYDATHGAEGVETGSIGALLPANLLLRPKVLPGHEQPITQADRHDFHGAARFYMVRNIQYRVARHSYPCLYWREKEGRWVEYYDFSNLCGALWLQAMWLLTADDVRRCQFPACNRIIDYKQPEKPLEHRKGERKKYKTRIDIKYCPKETGRHCGVYHWRQRKRQRPKI